MSTGSELKPCPFCGGEAETWDGTGVWHVFCTNKDCAAMGSPCLTEAEAIAAWNTRAEQGSDREAELQSALNKAAGNWAKVDALLRERTCKVESCLAFSYDFSHEIYYEFEMQCGGSFDWNDEEPPNYCPNCGAKVVCE